MITRSSGILLHISSLPGREGIGSMGNDAFAFVDFLHETRQQLWQILPLGPTGMGNSPYQSYSAFAGNLLYIGLDKLVEDGLLPEEELHKIPEFLPRKVDYDEVYKIKNIFLKKAYVVFKERFDDWKEAYYSFLGKNSWWLDDYALYRAIKDSDDSLSWNDWNLPLKKRVSHHLDVAIHKYSEELNFHRFVQFIFFRQWFNLKAYANKKGIRIIGDLPLYVAFDSSDVWTNQDLFMLDGEGRMEIVGGVPPDYFSETGQYWGCPVYNWARLEERGYDWWIARIHFNLYLFDMIRIDHFRGLESFWGIPEEEENAVNGKWFPAKGRELLSVLKSQLGNLPVIAEDLGIITPEVEKLRTDFGFPGMKVLQFAYGSDEKNDNLPHNYRLDSVVYTGTHDNDTTIGWLKSATRTEQKNLRKYYDSGWGHLHRKLIEAAWASVAAMAIIPMQDLLELDSRGRMNTPGTEADNWNWRFEWRMLKKQQLKFLRKLTKKYNRYNRKGKKDLSAEGRKETDE